VILSLINWPVLCININLREQVIRGTFMNTSHHQSSCKMITITQQLDEFQSNFYQEIATQAMLLSFIDYPDEVVKYSDEEE